MLAGPLQGRFLELLVYSLGARARARDRHVQRLLRAVDGGGAAAGRSHRHVRDRRAAGGGRSPLHRAQSRTPIASPSTSGPALETISRLDGEFDFVFIDADKAGYIDYYEAVLPRLSERGLIAADNTLSGGRAVDGSRPEIVAFNEHVMSDDRVISVLLPIRDGVTLIRRRS